MSIEKSFKETSGFISQLANTCISILKILIQSKFSNNLSSENGKTCIVLGNGPSLKTSLSKHKDFLKKHALFCVNSFSLSDEYIELKPQHYVILDHSFWKSDGKIIIDTLDALKTKTTWSIKLFVPQMASESKRFEELSKANPNIQLQYFNYTVFKGFPEIAHWFYSKNLAMPQSQNVLVATIFLAMNSNFKEIFVVGADHTWHENLHLDENNLLSLRHIHFYDDVEKTTYVPFKKGIHSTETFKVHEIFATWEKVFYGYIALENYSKYKNCKIYNASEITFVDAFERKKL